MVKIVRLVNNEEVIGKITEKKATVKIKNAAVIVPVGEGRMLWSSAFQQRTKKSNFQWTR